MRKFLFLLLYGCSYSLKIQIVYNYEYPIPKQYVPKAKPEYNFEEKIEIKVRDPRTCIGQFEPRNLWEESDVNIGYCPNKRLSVLHRRGPRIPVQDNQIRGLIMKPPQIVIFIQQGNNLFNRNLSSNRKYSKRKWFIWIQCLWAISYGISCLMKSTSELILIRVEPD